MAQIFVSYSRADGQFVKRFIPLIRRVYRSDNVWFDGEIHGGADWWKMILNQIERCDLFVYLVSNESLGSPYCQAELREALRLNKQILPVIVDGLKPSYPGDIAHDLGVLLRKMQYVDMSGGFDDADTIAKLYGAVKNLLDAAPQSLTAPETSTPTPEPPVRDKPPLDEPRAILRAAWIGFFAVIIAAIIGLVGVILTSRNGDSGGTNPEAATNVVQAPPSDEQEGTAIAEAEAELTALAATHTPIPGPTLNAADATLTVIFQQETATERARRAPTQTQHAYEHATATQEAVEERATATQYGVSTEVAERLATVVTWTSTPTSTPTPTNTPDATATLEAFRPQSNTDWTPVERKFDGVTMVLVPAGCFMMAIETCFDKPFWIDKYEVTNAEYGSIGCDEWSSEPTQPRNCVNWFEARDFCEARIARLPTEVEWEYAAHGPDGRVYPWGDGRTVRYSMSRIATPDGSRPPDASWVGALDMSGSLWEWTSASGKDYPYDSIYGSGSKLLTGDSLFVVPNGLISRAWINPFVGGSGYGFRCARSYS